MLFTISIIFTCSQNKPDQQETFKQENTQKSPVIITGKAPVVTFLDTCPPPRIIAIPQKMGDSYSIKTEDGSKTIKLLPPEVKRAGFFISMQNFTTRNGLAHNAVTRGLIDKTGNLWFSTYGGGASRYDGKSFTNYTRAQGLASNDLWSIYEDKAGYLWFGTAGGGASRYDGKSFRSYTTAQGLPNNDVHAIIEDNKGNLWFGTSGGVSRLSRDGSFTKFTTSEGLAGDDVSCIQQDNSGKIWFGTWSDGVSCYDGKSFINYSAADGLANNQVICIFKDKKNGNLWFGNGNGKVYWLDGIKKHVKKKRSFISYAIAQGLRDQVITITEDKNGNLWFGTGEGAFWLSWDKKSNPRKENFIGIATQQGLPNNHVNSILEDKSGNIWFCMDDGGVSLLNRDLKFLTSLTIDERLLHNKVATILEDEGQNIWLGTRGGIGALRLTPDGKSISRYTTSQGLPNNNIISIFQDKNKNVWISTFEGGVSCLSADGKFLTRYTAAQGLPHNPIEKTFEDKRGNFWFGSGGGGVARLNPGTESIIRYTTDQGLLNNFITNIFEDNKGNISFGTQRGLSRLGADGKTFTNYSIEEGFINNKVLEDNSGNLWFGTSDHGISRYDGKSFLSFTTDNGLPDDEVKDIVMDKEGIIWLLDNKGFTAIKGFVQNIKDTRKSPNQKNLPPSNELLNSELERNNFKPVFEIYNIKTGYPLEHIISNLCITHEGIIWAGLAARERSMRFDYNSIHKNPIPPNVFIQGIKINNEVVSWYDLSNNKEKTDSFTKAPNVIEEVTEFGKILDEDQRLAMRKRFDAIKFDSIARFYPVPVNLVLPYGFNNISFDFAAIEPARPGLVHYQYMMEGYEKEWNPVSINTSASYGNIHEGSYAFKLKAQSPDGVWSRPLTYTFNVLPPWYRTLWAYALYILILITVLWSLFRWRVGTLKKEKLLLEQKVALRTHELQQEKEKIESTLSELKAMQNQLIQSEQLASLNKVEQAMLNERLRISRELHDDIGSTLSGIVLYSHVAENQVNSNRPDEVENSLNKIQQSANDMVARLNDLVWAVNPLHSSVKDLVQKLQEYAIEMSMIKNIKVQVCVPGSLANIPLPVESLHNIYLLCKESINNAVKYSQANLLELSVSNFGSIIEFKIIDNGEGFDMATVKKGNGLINMQKRADETGAILSVNSASGKGTIVSLQYKIT